MKALLILLVSGAVLAQTPPPVKKAPATGATGATGMMGAAKTASAAPSMINPASLRAKAPDLFRVKFVTSHGDFVVEVHRDWAPLGADRFYNLVKARFFTGQAFYRFSPGFIVQFGIAAHPAVTAALANAKIKDDPVKESNKKGTFTFATSGKDSRTNDFFINLADNGSILDSQGFSPLGTVTEGMDIVAGLYSGYGEMKEMNNSRGPSQTRAMNEGKAYLDKEFPKLDTIKSATVIFPEPAAPAATAPKKAATGATGSTGATKSAPSPPPAKKQ